MKVLSMDIAWRNVGCVVMIDDEPVYAETIKTEKKDFAKTHRLISNQDLNSLIYTTKKIKKIIDKYEIDMIYVELPTGGQKSASAAKGLAFAYGFLVAPVVFNNIKYKTCTPGDVKKRVYKKTSGDKNGIMDYVRENYSLESKGKRIKTKINDTWYTGGEFEHIADAFIVYEVCSDEKVKTMEA